MKGSDRHGGSLKSIAATVEAPEGNLAARQLHNALYLMEIYVDLL
jgi:hypothetical protein